MERKQQETFDNATRIRFQPGNGTLYDTVWVFTRDQHEGFYFTWLNAPGPCGKTVYLQGHAIFGVLYPYYLAEKLGHNVEADLAALLILIYETTGRPVMLPPGFNPDGTPGPDENVDVLLSNKSPPLSFHREQVS